MYNAQCIYVRTGDGYTEKWSLKVLTSATKMAGAKKAQCVPFWDDSQHLQVADGEGTVITNAYVLTHSVQDRIQHAIICTIKYTHHHTVSPQFTAVVRMCNGCSYNHNHNRGSCEGKSTLHDLHNGILLSTGKKCVLGEQEHSTGWSPPPVKEKTPFFSTGRIKHETHCRLPHSQ